MEACRNRLIYKPVIEEMVPSLSMLIKAIDVRHCEETVHPALSSLNRNSLEKENPPQRHYDVSLNFRLRNNPTAESCNYAGALPSQLLLDELHHIILTSRELGV